MFSGYSSSAHSDAFITVVNSYLLEDAAPVVLPDTTPPESTILRPANSTTVNGRTVHVVAEASDDVGVTLVEFYVDSILKSASVGPDHTYIWNTTVIADGVHMLQTRALDAAGNSSFSDVVTVNVDNSAPDSTPPDIVITNPDDNAIVGNTMVTIAASATDNNGVSQVEFFVNGSSLLVDTAAPYEALWDTTEIADADYQLTATATDAVGNSATTPVTTVTVDSVAAAPVSTTPYLDFDGANDYVSLNNMDIPGSALTIEAWFNSRDIFNCGSGDCRIISKANGTSDSNHYWMISTINRSPNPVLRFRLKAGGSTTTLIANSGGLVNNTWYHVAAVYDGSTMKLYLDGIEVGSISKSGALDTNSAIAAWIGGNPGGATERPWDGFIDDVRFWNVARSQTEIANNKDNQLTPGTSGIISYYQFNEGAGQLVVDEAGNNNTFLGSSNVIDNSDPSRP